MKKILILPLFVLFTFKAHAETLILKNGSQVVGKIISQDAKKVKIEVEGAPMTYYMDEIESVQGAQKIADEPVAVKEPEPPAEQESVMAAKEPAKVQPASPPTASISTQKKELILKFIDVFGTKEAMRQNLQAMTDNLPADSPDYQKVKEGIKVDEIIDRLVPVYSKYFTEEDLKDYIAFYSSEKGKRLIDAISKVMRESVDVSAQYFQEKFPETP